MKLITVATPELVESIRELVRALPDNPVVEFLSHVQVGHVIVSEPRSAQEPTNG